MDRNGIFELFSFVIRNIKRMILWFIIFTGLILGGLLLLPKKYELTNTIVIGRFQEEILANAEAVAATLTDENFVSKALSDHQITLENTNIKAFVRGSKAKVLNEFRAHKGVNAIRFAIQYGDPAKSVLIYQAIIDQLILEHNQRLNNSIKESQQTIELLTKQKNMLEKQYQSVNKSISPYLQGKGKITAPQIVLLNQELGTIRFEIARIGELIRKEALKTKAPALTRKTKLVSQLVIPTIPKFPSMGILIFVPFFLGSTMAVGFSLFLDLFSQYRKRNS